MIAATRGLHFWRRGADISSSWQLDALVRRATLMMRYYKPRDASESIKALALLRVLPCEDVSRLAHGCVPELSSYTATDLATLFDGCSIAGLSSTIFTAHIMKLWLRRVRVVPQSSENDADGEMLHHVARMCRIISIYHTKRTLHAFLLSAESVLGDAHSSSSSSRTTTTSSSSCAVGTLSTSASTVLYVMEVYAHVFHELKQPLSAMSWLMHHVAAAAHAFTARESVRVAQLVWRQMERGGDGADELALRRALHTNIMKHGYQRLQQHTRQKDDDDDVPAMLEWLAAWPLVARRQSMTPEDDCRHGADAAEQLLQRLWMCVDVRRCTPHMVSALHLCFVSCDGHRCKTVVRPWEKAVLRILPQRPSHDPSDDDDDDDDGCADALLLVHHLSRRTTTSCCCCFQRLENYCGVLEHHVTTHVRQQQHRCSWNTNVTRMLHSCLQLFCVADDAHMSAMEASCAGRDAQRTHTRTHTLLPLMESLRDAWLCWLRTQNDDDDDGADDVDADERYRVRQRYGPTMVELRQHWQLLLMMMDGLVPWLHQRVCCSVGTVAHNTRSVESWMEVANVVWLRLLRLTSVALTRMNVHRVRQRDDDDDVAVAHIIIRITTCTTKSEEEMHALRRRWLTHLLCSSLVEPLAHVLHVAVERVGIDWRLHTSASSAFACGVGRNTSLHVTYTTAMSFAQHVVPLLRDCIMLPRPEMLAPSCTSTSAAIISLVASVLRWCPLLHRDNTHATPGDDDDDVVAQWWLHGGTTLKQPLRGRGWELSTTTTTTTKSSHAWCNQRFLSISDGTLMHPASSPRETFLHNWLQHVDEGEWRDDHLERVEELLWRLRHIIVGGENDEQRQHRLMWWRHTVRALMAEHLLVEHLENQHMYVLSIQAHRIVCGVQRYLRHHQLMRREDDVCGLVPTCHVLHRVVDVATVSPSSCSQLNEICGALMYVGVLHLVRGMYYHDDGGTHAAHMAEVAHYVVRHLMHLCPYRHLNADVIHDDRVRLLDVLHTAVGALHPTAQRMTFVDDEDVCHHRHLHACFGEVMDGLEKMFGAPTHTTSSVDVHPLNAVLLQRYLCMLELHVLPHMLLMLGRTSSSSSSSSYTAIVGVGVFVLMLHLLVELVVPRRLRGDVGHTAPSSIVVSAATERKLLESADQIAKMISGAELSSATTDLDARPHHDHHHHHHHHLADVLHEASHLMHQLQQRLPSSRQLRTHAAQQRMQDGWLLHLQHKHLKT